MNIIFFLLPKSQVAYASTNNTIRQALEKMEHHRYSAIPVLDEEGKYFATLSEGDLLWLFKNEHLTLEKSEQIKIKDIKFEKDIKSIHINKEMDELVDLIVNQNFVPVVDDMNTFIGIITRKQVISYLKDKVTL